jgi:hypothetical protein
VAALQRHPENGLHQSATTGSMLIIGGVLAGIGVPDAIEAIRPLFVESDLTLLVGFTH